MMTAPSSPSSSPPPMNRRRKSWARRCERACCSVVAYLPLAFIYGLSTWAIWVEAGIGFSTTLSKWTSENLLSECFYPTLTYWKSRHNYLHHRHYSLPPPELVIHYCRLHRSRIACQFQRQNWLLPPSYP